VLESAPPSKRMPHPDGSEKFGIGMRLRSTTSPVRTNVPNGVEKMKARIGDRKLLCTREVWEDGLSSAHKDQMVRLGVRHNGNSFATSLMGYHYPDNGKEDPVKDGREDPMDGMRYDVINWHYHGGARPNPPQARAEPMRAPSLSTGGERTSWRGRRVGR